VPILTWLNPSGVDAEAAAADQIDVAIGSVDEPEALLKRASPSVRVRLNLDTGMAPEGCPVHLHSPEELGSRHHGLGSG
jgi:alanine racemase